MSFRSPPGRAQKKSRSTYMTGNKSAIKAGKWLGTEC